METQTFSIQTDADTQVTILVQPLVDIETQTPVSKMKDSQTMTDEIDYSSQADSDAMSFSKQDRNLMKERSIEEKDHGKGIIYDLGDKK